MLIEHEEVAEGMSADEVRGLARPAAGTLLEFLERFASDALEQ